MLLPDVTEILDDPEVGGGVPFQVRRKIITRRLGSNVVEPLIFDLTGSIQPVDRSAQPSTAEDNLSESIVVRAAFEFQAGTNNGASFTEPDEVLFNGAVWRVTRAENWSMWGFSTAYATKVNGVS